MSIYQKSRAKTAPKFSASESVSSTVQKQSHIALRQLHSTDFQKTPTNISRVVSSKTTALHYGPKHDMTPNSKW